MVALYSQVPLDQLSPKAQEIFKRVKGTRGVEGGVYPRVGLIPTDAELELLDQALKNLGFGRS